MIPIYQIIFYVFSIFLIVAAIMVITAHNPVRAVLSLVLAFFCSSILWIMLQAEFLGLVLIFVYVGAVMTLFLFVVMMLNVDLSKMREKFVKFLPATLLVGLLFLVALSLTLGASHIRHAALATLPAHYSNTKALGHLIYTRYVYPFEIAGAILFVAIVAAITLAFHGRKPNTRRQKVSDQLSANKSSRLKVIKMKAEKS